MLEIVPLSHAEFTYWFPDWSWGSLQVRKVVLLPALVKVPASQIVSTYCNDVGSVHVATVASEPGKSELPWSHAT